MNDENGAGVGPQALDATGETGAQRRESPEAQPARPGETGFARSGGGPVACQRLPATTDSSREAVLERRRRLMAAGYRIEQISGTGPEIEPALLAGSIDRFSDGAQKC